MITALDHLASLAALMRRELPKLPPGSPLRALVGRIIDEAEKGIAELRAASVATRCDPATQGGSDAP